MEIVGYEVDGKGLDEQIILEYEDCTGKVTIYFTNYYFMILTYYLGLRLLKIIARL